MTRDSQGRIVYYDNTDVDIDDDDFDITDFVKVSYTYDERAGSLRKNTAAGSG